MPGKSTYLHDTIYVGIVYVRPLNTEILPNLTPFGVWYFRNVSFKSLLKSQPQQKRLSYLIFMQS